MKIFIVLAFLCLYFSSFAGSKEHISSATIQVKQTKSLLDETITSLYETSDRVEGKIRASLIDTIEFEISKASIASQEIIETDSKKAFQEKIKNIYILIEELSNLD